MASRIHRVLAVLLLVLPACSRDQGPTIEQAREELLGAITDVRGSDGYRYGSTDDRGHEMDTAKVIQVAESGQFVAVYHWWDEPTGQFTSSLATSTDLLQWSWQLDLAHSASMPTIAAASDGGYVVAWEQEPDNHLKFAYYPSLDHLLGGVSTKQFELAQTLSDCAEGTPNIYMASSDFVDFGFHFYANCESDRQARGTTDWETSEIVEEPLLDRSILLQGYRGSIGDRDVIEFSGHQFTFLEAQMIQGDWRTWRIFLYDEGTAAHFTDSQRSFPTEPPSEHVFIVTHKGSSAFTNITVSIVEIDGKEAVVVGLFIPHEGAMGYEAGQLIYYRYLDG